MITIGIDPGNNGAIAWLEDGKITRLRSQPMMVTGQKKTKGGKIRDVRRPDLVCMRKVVSRISKLHKEKGLTVFLERIQAMPGDGRVGSFWFGYHMGLWEALLTAFHIPYRLVIPMSWKLRVFGRPPKAPKVKLSKLEAKRAKDKKKREMKQASLAKARELFDEKWHNHFTLGKHDGYAEAALIAHFGVLKLEEERLKEEKKAERVAKAAERFAKAAERAAKKAAKSQKTS